MRSRVSAFPRTPPNITVLAALCVQSAAEIDLSQVVPLGDGNAAFGDAPAHQALERLRDEAMQSLESVEATFAPLLPSDDAALAERAIALAAWCEGFLYGLASRGTLDLNATSPEVKEMVQDLVQFSRATSTEDEDQEIEENAYARAGQVHPRRRAADLHGAASARRRQRRIPAGPSLKLSRAMKPMPPEQQEYARRRARLMKAMGPRDVAIIPSATEVIRNGDSTIRFGTTAISSI